MKEGAENAGEWIRNLRGETDLDNLIRTIEKAEKKLEAASGKNTKALINQAAALQQVTIFGDEVIISAQALIGAYTDDEEQLKKATEATLDLAAAKGMDLNAAADLVGKSLGSSTNALARYGVEVRGVRGSTERLESLTTNVARLFGGQARAATDTLSGSIEQMKNAIGDANEILGEEFVPIIKAISKAMKEGAENAGEWIRNLRGETDLDKLIRTIEKAGGDADKLRLKREKDRLSSIQGQLKVGASLGMLEGAKTIEQEKQLTLMDDQFNAMEDLNLSSEEYNKLLATSEKTAEKWYDWIAGGKFQDWIDEKAGYDRDAAINAKNEAIERLHNVSALKEENKLSKESQDVLTGKVELKNKEAEILAEIKRLEEKIAGTQTEGFFEKLFGVFGDEEAMANIADKTKMYSKAVLDIGDSYMKLQQMQMNQAKQAELDGVKGIRNERIRQKKIDAINKKYEGEQAKINRKVKKLKRAQTVINTGVAIMEVLADPTITTLFGKIAMVSLVTALGATQLAMIDAQKYQYGGAVGGRRHSQGGTMIEAERGEFVVSRPGVEAAGLEALNRINAGVGVGGGSTIIINNPILGKDMIEDEIIPQIKEALRRGASI